MTMEIQNWQDMGSHPSILAEFDLYFPQMQITWHKLKVINTKKGHKFVSLPSWCEKCDDGSKKYHPYISMSKEKGENFQKKVLELINETGFLTTF